MPKTLEEAVCEAVSDAIAHWSNDSGEPALMMSIIGAATFYLMDEDGEQHLQFLPFRQAQTFEAVGMVEMLTLIGQDELQSMVDI